MARRRPRVCIYCGRQANSLEHVIPKWIPRQFGLERDVMTHDRAIGVERIGRIPFVHFAAHIYCAECHKTVNRLIENRPTRELLKRLFPGDAAILDRIDQQRLAAWAVKMTYAKWGLVRRVRGVSWACNFVFAIGQLAFKVWGPTAGTAAPTYKSPTTFATRVWPPGDDVARWPPGRVLDDDGVTDLWAFDPRAFKVSAN